MENKETIAKALLKYDHPDVVWEKIKLTKGLAHEEYLNRAEAVIKAQEADVPKELEDYLLSDREICEAMLSGMNTDTNIDEMIEDGFLSEHHRQIAEAQLKAVAPFVEAVKKVGRERIVEAWREYRRGNTELEQVAEAMGISVLELADIKAGGE